jgi:hypothetical protein
VPRRVGQRTGRCTVCAHTQRTRIDFLIATGATIRALAARFNLNANAIYNHSKKHISDEYRAAVRLGPFESEDRLRQLCAENGTSVLETLRALNAGVSARWLVAFETANDDKLVALSGVIRKNLELMGRLTKELAPPPSSVTTNNFVLFENPQYLEAISRIAMALRPYAEAREAVTAALRSLGPVDDRLVIDAPRTALNGAAARP